jgi:hypothetical protein
MRSRRGLVPRPAAMLMVAVDRLGSCHPSKCRCRSWARSTLGSSLVGGGPGIPTTRVPGGGKGVGPSPPPAWSRSPQPVVALKMSLLPKAGGQSPNGQGAGNTWWPASNEACRQASMAGQSAVRRTSVHTPAP